MSDTNTISFTFSKDFQPLIQTAFDDFRQYLKDKAQNELIIEQAKIKASKEKWDAALKTINRNGALDRILLQAADHFLGDATISPKINTPESTKANKERSLVSLISEFRISIYTDPEFGKSADLIIDKISMYASIHSLLRCIVEHDARITLKFIKSNIKEDDVEHFVKLYQMLSDSEKDIAYKIVNFEL